MPRSEAEGSSSDSDDDSLVALSDLSSPCRDDARPSADPASDAAVLASERGQVEYTSYGSRVLVQTRRPFGSTSSRWRR